LSGCTVPSSTAAAAARIINISKVPAAPAANPPPCTAQIQFHGHHPQQQQLVQQQRFQFEKPKPASSEKSFHIEMPSAPAAARSGKEPEVITFSFDHSVCTSSAATSFFTNMSSQLISMSDNSVAAPSSRNKAAHCARNKAEADDDGKCHCPKKK
jgi:hypothetical protein